MRKVAIIGLWLLLGCAVACAEEPVSFKGKTITVVVASAPGGGTDMSGRLIAPLLASLLPGKPSIIVRNIPGAEGVTAMNYFVKQVAPDGLTVTMGSTTQADPLLYRRPQSQFDPTTFAIIGGAGRGGTALVIRRQAEARLYDTRAAPVVMGALGGVPRSGMLATAWGVDVLGWNAKWVLGYRGTKDLMLALSREEIDMTSTANLFQLQEIMADPRFKILSQSGSVQNGQHMARTEFGDAPIFTSMIEEKVQDAVTRQAFDYWTSITSLDKWLALPPKTPAAYVQAYREAYKSLSADPAFVELGRKISEDFEPMSYRDVEALIARIGSTPPEAIAYIGAMLRRQGVTTE
jgi:tripartite-type tricarboxylate transporter receptor subunit TctC